MEMGELDALLAAGRYHQIERRLRDLEPRDDDERVRLRGALASHGRAPVSDLVALSTRLARAGDRAGAPVSAEAVRRLAAAGARATARRLLDDAIARWPAHDALILAAEQLETGPPVGATRAEWEVHRLLGAARLDDARAALERAASDPGARAWALRLLTDLHRREHAFANAAACLETAWKDAPEADDAPLMRLSAAFARWAGGEVEDALEGLHALRDDTAGGRGAAGYAHSTCREVLETLDREPEARDGGPRWALREPLPPMAPMAGPPGVAVVGWALGAFGRVVSKEGLGDLPTLPHVRRALDVEGAVCIRTRISPATLAPALEQAALVILEEERPTNTGFLFVVGWDPVAGLLLLQDPARPGPYLRDLGDQRERSALFDGSALVIAGLGDEGRAAADTLAAAGVRHEERLDVVDGLEMDEHGRTPPQARIAALAEAALEAAPDHPLPRKRLGEALLAQLEGGGPHDGRFEQWYAEARRRFPSAEWPFQIYARALEHFGRPHEAGIAWADAAASDPFDERNFVGMARVHAMVGALDKAEEQLRRACTLAPRDAAAVARRADLALRRDDLDEARILSEIAVDLDPSDLTAAFVRATVLERDDRFDAAEEQLARVQELDHGRAWSRVRRVRRLAHDGHFVRAAEVARDLRPRFPGDEDTWLTESWLGFCEADADRAIGAAVTGIQRLEATRGLVDALGRALGALATPDDVSAWLDRVVPVVRSLQALLDLASALSRAGLLDEALGVGRHAMDASPGDANGPWRVAQILLGDRAARRDRVEEIHALLDETIARAGPYPHPRVIKGLLVVDDDPERALTLAREADDRVSPALVWLVLERCYVRLDRQDEAAAVRSRMPELFGEGILEPAGFLRTNGFVDEARRLLAASVHAHPDHHSGRVQLAHTAAAAGDPAGALELLLAVEQEDGARCPRDALMAIAEEARAWDTVVRVAELDVELGMRESGGGFYDTWPSRAFSAGGRLALGDATFRDTLLRRVPRHPDVRSILLRVERQLGDRRAAEDAAELARLAPGSLRQVDRELARRAAHE